MSEVIRDKKGDKKATPVVSRDAPNVALGDTITATARRLGVSVRTVQRRLDSGILRSIERDGRRFVLLDGDATQGDTTRQNVVSRDTTQRDSVTRHATPDDATRDTTQGDMGGRYVTQLERENAFLKAQIEEGNRNAAELRAALRKALEAQPRALPMGASEPAPTPQESPRMPPVETGGADSISPDFDEINNLIFKCFKE